MRVFYLIPALALISSPAFADSPFSFGGSVGYEFPVSGKVIDETSSASVNLTALNSSLAGTGILRLRGTDFKDSSEAPLKATIEVRYALTQTSEMFGAITYSQADGKSTNIGCVETIVSGAPVCSIPLTATFSDFKQMGVELGYRQWLESPFMRDRLFPYFALRAGATQTDAISATVAAFVPSNPNAVIGTWNLYDDKVTYVVGGDVGATYLIAPFAEIGAEVGVRYNSKLSEIDTNLTPLGLAAANDKSDRITIPVSVRLNAAF
jgi:hypothetical protein